MKYAAMDKKSSTYLQLIILISSFFILFGHTITELAKDWMKNPNYSHGFLVPFITAYILWQKREDLYALSIDPSNWGLLVIILGMLLYMVASIGAELFTMRTAIVVTIVGLLMYFAGSKITKKIIVPVFYLMFMIPIPALIWNRLAFPLQIFSSTIAENIIRAFGITILREGNILYLTNTTLEVVDACSGLRSLTTLLALSAAFAYLSSHMKVNKWILFLSSVPVAITVNIARLSVTAALASYFGEKIAQGFLHEFSGLLIYTLALAMLFGVHIILLRTEKIFNEKIPRG